MFGWSPKARNELEENKPRIDATVEKIEKDGSIEIKYDPPIALVPNNWNKYFDREELAKLSDEDRIQNEKRAKEIMHVRFVQNSVELP